MRLRRKNGDAPPPEPPKPGPVRVTFESGRSVDLEVGKPLPHVSKAEGPITGKGSPFLPPAAPARRPSVRVTVNPEGPRHASVA